MDFPQRVLIVDDDPIQKAALEQLFTASGSATVAVASNGLGAISTLENSAESFDLIVLELVMPEYDGIELISYLESQNEKAALLLMSGLPRHVIDMSNTLAKV
ncbi:MAG: response regulator, partial [Pseudomonadota bacterium]